MSIKHPIIAVTGSSGARRGSVMDAFQRVFSREGIVAAYVDGDSFHRHNRVEMAQAIEAAARVGNPHLSHFGPEANLFDEQETLFKSYGESGTGRCRTYIHDAEQARKFSHYHVGPGEFTPWERLPETSDLMVYQGLHGYVRTDSHDLGQYVDLKLGVVPVINLEWIQKIHRDTRTRGYSHEAVVDTILRRMHDYVHYIVPQFRRSDINFQRVPIVDTANPLAVREAPIDDESVVVIRFRRPEEFPVDFPCLLRHLHDSWMSRRNTIVVPGAKLSFAMQLILTPVMQRMMDAKRKAL